MTDTTLTPDQVESPAASAPPRLQLNASVRAGLALLGVAIVAALIGVFFLDEAAHALSDDTDLPISWSHWLGTDAFGRDMFARALVAAALSLAMAAAATMISIVAGTLIGTSLWVSPKRIREPALRVVEVATSYPELLLAVIIAAILGAGPWQLVVAIGVANIPSTARLTANLAASVYQRDFVTTARLLGVRNTAIIRRHLLPNMAEPMLIQIAAAFSTGLVAMSALSFVGLGVQTPLYDLGRLLADGIPAIYTRPLEVAGPVVMIIVLSVAAMLIGDGMAAAANPHTAGTRPAASASGSSTSRAAAGPEEFVLVEDLRVARADGVELVRGVSLRAAEGEILGIVGESGSGKSLTVAAIARLLPDGLTATASALRVGELDMLARPSRRDLARTIALVYQDPGTTFSPALQMGNQLTDPIRVHQKLPGRAARHVMLDALATVRITSPQRLMDSHPHELSGGMRQRAMIASALASNAELIIADEPTTALDVTVQQEILRELVALNRRSGTTMLFISHDLAVVAALCHRIIVMKDGEIVEELSPDALWSGRAEHPYTQMLLAAVPRLDPPEA